MEKDMTTHYLDSMDGGGAAKYLCRPGFIFTNSPAPARGEFERRYSCSEIRDISIAANLFIFGSSLFFIG